MNRRRDLDRAYLLEARADVYEARARRVKGYGIRVLLEKALRCRRLAHQLTERHR